jgi:tetratricopeptide (TPR) repeat protein
MAIEKRKAQPHRHDEAEARTDFEAVLDHVRDNPVLYAAIFVFTIVVVIAGFTYLSMSEASRQEQATTFVESLLIEDDAERAAALAEAAANLRGEMAAEALYMAGESAYRAGDLEGARRYFERVRTEHAGSAPVAAALEGLGFILEEEENHEAAIPLYREIQNGHAAAFEARRQWYNLGRATEKTGDLEGAIAHYNAQIDGFPGSTVAQQAQAALDRLRREHAELFPEPTPLQATGVIPGDPVVTLEPPALEVLLGDDLPELSVDTDAAEDAPSDDAPAPVAVDDESVEDEGVDEDGEAAEPAE